MPFLLLFFLDLIARKLHIQKDVVNCGPLALVNGLRFCVPSLGSLLQVEDATAAANEVRRLLRYEFYLFFIDHPDLADQRPLASLPRASEEARQRHRLARAPEYSTHLLRQRWNPATTVHPRRLSGTGVARQLRAAVRRTRQTRAGPGAAAPSAVRPGYSLLSLIFSYSALRKTFLRSFFELTLRRASLSLVTLRVFVKRCSHRLTTASLDASKSLWTLTSASAELLCEDSIQTPRAALARLVRKAPLFAT